MSRAPKPFWGDDEHDEGEPQDFINAIEYSFFGRTLGDGEKTRQFQLCLKSNGTAKLWFDALEPEEHDTWSHLQQAFSRRWPVTIVVPKTKVERIEDLTSTIIAESALGTKVVVKEVEEHAHVAWANKVERLAKAAQDSGAFLLPEVMAKMPKALKKAAGVDHTTWDGFCTAVRRASLVSIKEAQSEENERRALEAKVARMEREQTPGRGIRDVLRAASLGQSAGIPKPSGSPPIIPFTTVARPAPNPTRQFRPDTERFADIRKLALPHHPDTPAGHELYKAQLTAWEAKHGTAAPNELRPYPLSPGTAPAASDECWTCGREGHRGGGRCDNTPLPNPEQRWRSIATIIRRKAETVAQPVSLVMDQFESHAHQLEDHDIIALAAYFNDLAMNRGKAEGLSTS
ncbi:hypothetical protein BD779DRAFT_1677957 [Infundibulicybe gibba]|nr:hypothetical protein BD779DRAFT_1677957 [Infundibulicybe gibba]